MEEAGVVEEAEVVASKREAWHLRLVLRAAQRVREEDRLLGRARVLAREEQLTLLAWHHARLAHQLRLRRRRAVGRRARRLKDPPAGRDLRGHRRVAQLGQELRQLGLARKLASQCLGGGRWRLASRRACPRCRQLGRCLQRRLRHMQARRGGAATRRYHAPTVR